MEELEKYQMETIPAARAREMLVHLRNVDYQWYVDSAKRILNNVLCQQAVIGYYAVKICTIRHGGRSNGYYTISDYAADIGMNRKTLQEWVAIYRRVIQHLGIDPMKMTSEEWKAARRVAYHVESDTRKNNIQSGKGKTKLQKHQLPSREEIKRLWSENLDGPSITVEAHQWRGHLNTLYTNLKKRDLNLLDEFTLTEFMNIADKISDLLNDHLTERKRNANKKAK